MPHALVFDCEFLTAAGAPSRFWCGPHDPDPVVAQIVLPQDRQGQRVPLDPLFTKLTGITEAGIDHDALPLAAALDRVKDVAAGQPLWSWGKDEFNMVAISCYVQGLTPPLPATQFGNACTLLLRAGMAYEDIIRTRSNQLADHFQITHPPLRGHDALDDALSVAYVLQALLRQEKLSPDDLTLPSKGL
jgi:hypothetical protein